MSSLTKIFKATWSFLNSKLLGYAIALTLVIWIAQMCSNIRDLKEEIDNANQNNSALVDTLKKERLKTGELQYSIDGFIGDIETLKKLNKGLADEVENKKVRLFL